MSTRGLRILGAGLIGAILAAGCSQAQPPIPSSSFVARATRSAVGASAAAPGSSVSPGSSSAPGSSSSAAPKSTPPAATSAATADPAQVNGLDSGSADLARSVLDRRGDLALTVVFADSRSLRVRTLPGADCVVEASAFYPQEQRPAPELLLAAQLSARADSGGEVTWYPQLKPTKATQALYTLHCQLNQQQVMLQIPIGIPPSP